MTLRVGGFYHQLTFKESKVDGLLNGLAKLFSCRYSTIGGPQDEAGKEKLRDLKTFDKFNCAFQPCLVKNPVGCPLQVRRSNQWTMGRGNPERPKCRSKSRQGCVTSTLYSEPRFLARRQQVSS